MKYSIIEYDFNRPTNKVLKEPLDSDYGIAVRCWKNGSIVDSALLVDGLSATATEGTWQLFDLSTGSTPCTNNYVISIDKAETFSTNDGVNGSFNLQVNEADLGYMEVKES